MSPVTQTPTVPFAPLTNGPMHRRFADLRLKEKFLALTKYLPRGRESLCRPGVFHSRARDEGAATPLGLDVRDALVDVMRSACATNNPTVVAQTRIQVRGFLDELDAQIEAACDPKFSRSRSLQDVAVEGEEETARFMAKLAIAGTTRDESDLRAVVDECAAESQAIDDFRASAERKLNYPSAQLPRAASR